MKHLLIAFLFVVSVAAQGRRPPTLGTNEAALYRETPSIVNVKAQPYGAKGDGVTDDTAAVKAAYLAVVANSGGTLYFPAGDYLFNLVVTNANITIEFNSSMGYDTGSVVITNQVRAANTALPILRIGDGTNWAKGFRLIGGTFRGAGTPGCVGIRYDGGAYETDSIGADWYNFSTNIWVQGSGDLPCSLNNIINGMSQAANIAGARGAYVASPATGTGFTTATRFNNFHFLSSAAVGTNCAVLEYDASQVELSGVYFDFLNGTPLIANNNTALVNDQQPVLWCSNVRFDGSSGFPILKVGYTTSQRIIDVVVGDYTWNGQAQMFDGTILQQEVCKPIMDNTGHTFFPFIRGAATIQRYDIGTTNFLAMQIGTDDNVLLSIKNTNGPIHFTQLTNMFLMKTNGVQMDGTVLVRAWGSEPYSDIGTNEVRILMPRPSDNTVQEAIHVDAYSNAFTENEGVAISLGIKTAAIGEATSRLVHYGDIFNTRATRLRLQTHSITNGVWNDSVLLDELGGMTVQGIITNTALVADRVVVTGAGKELQTSVNVDPTELNFINNVTTNISTTFNEIAAQLAALQGDGYTLLPDVVTSSGALTPIFTNTVANDSMITVLAEIDVINATASQIAHRTIAFSCVNDGGTLAGVTSYPSQINVGAESSNYAVDDNDPPPGTAYIITVQNNGASPTDVLRWRMRYKVLTLSP